MVQVKPKKGYKMKNMNSRNAKRLAVLIPALLGGMAWGQEAKLPTIVVTDSKSADDAYRVESTYSIGPLGAERLLDIPNSIAIALLASIPGTNANR